MYETEESLQKGLLLLEIFERLKLIVKFQSQTVSFLKAYTSKNQTCS
jgi:hypothetical protein